LQATKSIISGTNTQALTAKADLLKEEMDEAMNKVELCKVTTFSSNGTQTFMGRKHCFFLTAFIAESLRNAASVVVKLH